MKKQSTVVFNTFFNGFTGYGIKIQEYVRGLLAKGINVKSRVLFCDETYNCKIPDDIKATFVKDEQKDIPFEVVFYPPRYLSEFPGNSTRKQILYTMWETSQLPQQFVDNCNQHHALIVPTSWNKETFQSSGVRVPIYVSPLGVDTSIFKPDPRRFPSECVFVTAGRVAHGFARKGIDYAMEIFRRAFPYEENVKLRVKCTPDCVTKPNFDSRISIIKAIIEPKSLAEIYQDSIAYLDCTTAEGFGLHQVEANACGKVVIGSRFSGKPIFNCVDNNIAVKYNLVKVNVDNPYQCIGKWAKINDDDMIDKLRYVYNHQEEVWLNGQMGVKTIQSKFSIDNMVNSLIDVLSKIGVLS